MFYLYLFVFGQVLYGLWELKPVRDWLLPVEAGQPGNLYTYMALSVSILKHVSKK